MKTINTLGVAFIVGATLAVVSSASDRPKDRDATPKSATVSPVRQAAATGITQPRAVSGTKGPTTTVVDTATQSHFPNSPNAPVAGEQIKWQVFASAGGRTASVNYKADLTVGQTAAGVATSASFKLRQGFWQQFPVGCCVGLTGNVDCDPEDGADISDLTALIDNLYISLSPLCCPAEANIDGDPDGGIDISDLTALIDYLYISFTLPAACL